MRYTKGMGIHYDFQKLPNNITDLLLCQIRSTLDSILYRPPIAYLPHHIIVLIILKELKSLDYIRVV